MGPSELIREVARASRLGDHVKVEELLTIGSYTIDAVREGWRLADRTLRRDPPLPQLSEPMDLSQIARSKGPHRCGGSAEPSPPRPKKTRRSREVA